MTTLVRVNSETLTGGAQLREARPGDEDGILACIQALAVYEREPDAVENTAEAIHATLFGDTPRVFCYVVGLDSRIVGIALWFFTYSTWTGKHGMWLEDLFVYDECRGRGYGKALITRLAADCIEGGYPRLEWTVLDWNAPSIAFYRSLGAEPMDEWTTQRLSGETLARFARGEVGRQD